MENAEDGLLEFKGNGNIAVRRGDVKHGIFTNFTPGGALSAEHTAA